jgi:hypothetical protein
VTDVSLTGVTNGLTFTKDVTAKTVTITGTPTKLQLTQLQQLDPLGQLFLSAELLQSVQLGIRVQMD